MTHVAAGEITAKADLVQNFRAEADYMCELHPLHLARHAQERP